MRRAGERARIPLLVDSAGTGDWHIGNPPDPRAIATAARHGVDLTALRARQVVPEDFGRFDHIVALDPQNLRDLRRIALPAPRAALSLLLDYVTGREGQGVTDPYFGDADGFEPVWRDICKGVDGLLDAIRAQPRG